MAKLEEAEEASQAKEAAADDAAREEADKNKELREGVAGGERSGADIGAGVKDGHELAAKLKAEGKDHLAWEVEELALKMDEAAKAKLDADAKENNNKVFQRAWQ